MLKKLFYILIVISTFLLICTSIKYRLGPLASATMQTPIAAIASFYLVPQKREIRPQIFFFVWFALVVLYNSISGDNYYYSMELTLFTLLSILMTLLFESFIVKSSDRKFLRIFTYSHLIGIMIVCVITIIVDLKMPGIVRQMVGFSVKGDTNSIIFYNRLGVCTYGFPHSLPILVPPLVFLYKKSRKLKFFAVLLLVFVGYLVYISGITTSLLLFLLTFMWSIYFISGSFKKSSPKIIFFAFISVLFLFDDVQIGTLEILNQLIPADNENAHVRINEMIDAINGKVTNDLGTRQDYYELSFRYFFDNIFFGTNSQIGGHSTILDQFASLGLFGGVPFLLMIIYSIRYLLQNSPNEFKPTLVISFIGFILMLALKNANEINLWFFMFCLSPAILRFSKLQERDPKKFVRNTYRDKS